MNFWSRDGAGMTIAAFFLVFNSPFGTSICGGRLTDDCLSATERLITYAYTTGWSLKRAIIGLLISSEGSIMFTFSVHSGLQNYFFHKSFPTWTPGIVRTAFADSA